MVKRSTDPVTRRLLHASTLLLVGVLGLGPRLHAQLPASAFSLSFPETVMTAIKSAGSSGASWDVVRRYGFSLNVTGQGEFTISVVAVVVSKGKVVRTWTSAKRQVAAGTSTLSGRDFLPPDSFLQGIPKILGEQGGQTISVDDAKRAIAGGSASTLLGRVSTSTNGVIFVLIPEGTSRSTTTNPRFARTETLSD